MLLLKFLYLFYVLFPRFFNNISDSIKHIHF